MSALLGYVTDIVIGAVLGLEGVDIEMKGRVLRAVNKVIVSDFRGRGWERG
jgi:hypothetical protein